MFGLFSTKPPLDDPRDKAWTELSMLWLAEQFGTDRLRNVGVLTPTPEDFRDSYHAPKRTRERKSRRD